MKKLLFSLLLISGAASAQVMVDGKDLNKEVEMFEVHVIVKPFTSKECMGADTGTNDFKPHYYDLKRQAIYDKEGKKFEKGEFMRLRKYLADQGWEQVSQRDVKVGNVTGQAFMFQKKKS